MRLTTLGTGGCFATPSRGAPGAIVEASSVRWIVDCGENTLRSLANAGYDENEIDGILLTHYHLDHTGGLAPFLFALWAQKCRVKPLKIIGPSGLNRLAAGLSSAYGEWLDELGFPLRWREVIPPCEMELEEGVHLRCVEVRHSTKMVCIGYRLEVAGKILAISGDTEICNGLRELATDADLLLVEAGNPDDDPRPGHVTPTALGSLAADAGVQRIVLTHFAFPEPAELLRQATEKAFGGSVSAAADGDVFEI